MNNGSKSPTDRENTNAEQTPPPKKKKKIWLWVLVIVVALGIIGMFMDDSEESSSGGNSASTTASPRASSSAGTPTDETLSEAEIEETRSINAELRLKALANIRENGPDGYDILFIFADDVIDLFGEPDGIKEDRTNYAGEVFYTWEYSNYNMRITTGYGPISQTNIVSGVQISTAVTGFSGFMPISGINIGDDMETAVRYLMSLGYTVDESEIINDINQVTLKGLYGTPTLIIGSFLTFGDRIGGMAILG